MARLFNGSSDCAAASIDLSAVNKLTLGFWLYWDSYANDDAFAFEHTADFGSNAGGFVVCPNFSSGTFAVALNGNGGQCFATFSRPSAATWHQYVALLDMSKASNEVDSVYVDGSSQSLSYTQNNNNSGNFANSTLNFMSRNGASHFGAGRLAEIGLWPGVLLDAGEIVSLAHAVVPLLIRPTAHPYYWPLMGRYSPEIELFYGAGAGATLTGTSHADHPRIISAASGYAPPRGTPAPPAEILTGTFTPVGAFMKETAAQFSGGLSFAGALYKEVSIYSAGEVESEGDLTKSIGASFSGSMASAGSPLLARLLSLSGGFTPTGALSFVTNKMFSGVQALAGSLVKNFATRFPGVLSFLAGLRAGRPEAPCVLTLGEMRARVYKLLGENPDAPVYWTVAEVNYALNMAERWFALATLCIEREASLALTSGQTFYTTVSEETGLTGYLVPLAVTESSKRIKPDTAHALDARNRTWRNDTGTPTSYLAMGANLFAVHPTPSSGGVTLGLTFAGEPTGMTVDTDVPDIPGDRHPALVDWAYAFCRLKEGGQEMQKGIEYLKRAVDSAQQHQKFVRSRSRGQGYDMTPFDLAAFDRGRLDIKLKARVDVKKKRDEQQGE
jgi:hypothetical protein